MNWLITENNKKINTYEIPIISIEDLRVEISNLRHRPIGFFGKQEYENVRLYVVLSDDKQGKLMIHMLFLLH